MATPLLIYGSSGHAKVAADTALATGQFDVVGFLDDHPDRIGTVFLNRPVLAGLAEQPRAHKAQLFIAIGDNLTRLRIAAQLQQHPLGFATLIHPRAVVASNVKIGQGCLIAAGAVIQPGCTLGEHVIINTLAGVDHDCTLETGVHIAPGAHLAGRVTVGRATMVGIGACIRDGMTLGCESMVGAGAVVIKPVPDRVTVVGNPARVHP